MASVSLCSSPSSLSAAIAQKQQRPNLSLSRPNPNVPFLSHSLSSLRLSSSPKPLSTSPFVAKFSDSGSSVAEAEPESPVFESELQTETIVSEPKRDEIFAVVMVGSRQYIVFPGRYLYTQRLKGANVNDKIILNKVLLVGSRTSTWIGKPVVTNAAVHAVVEEQLLDDKVIVFKYKKKKNYKRKIGHRQPITRIRILGITGYEDYPASTLPDTEPTQ
ncbi:50S ribosomal protein L21, chloroplastic [Ipomoea triloba]|uniref:50S ribosomal protein L21, chloroplastic n=1 Tax=Ipomoea triloba TaxID=35885 RepID=UPI00125E68FC|nr:50S ribosomal protein L21, chloroplastic [Ipomoea triloba]GMD53051.1 50S ribosomal protein L21, chloroplastic [Ipomoea batatas]GMD57753.1 50S ribosomal protein L21, chloroplastic [Ipomoea batatas]